MIIIPKRILDIPVKTNIKKDMSLDLSKIPGEKVKNFINIVENLKKEMVQTVSISKGVLQTR